MASKVLVITNWDWAKSINEAGQKRKSAVTGTFTNGRTGRENRA